MPKRIRLALLVVWLCFMARGAFHAAMLPLWEGFDEYAHFAVIEQWLNDGVLPRLDTQIPVEIQQSLISAPVSRQLLWMGATTSHDDYWRGVRILHSPMPPLQNYEAQQPPLYYWMVLPVAWIVNPLPLSARVVAIRMYSVLIASLFLPLTFIAARRRMGDAGALGTVALAALFPGLMPDVCRIGNDSLALSMFALLIVLMAEGAPWLVGIVLGLGLLTKATFLAVIPALVAVAVVQRTGWRRLLVILGIASLLSGWWYWWIHGMTGSWSGWVEAVPQPGKPPLLMEALHVHWLQAADAVFRSFVWFGDWSFLTVRRWMYYLAGVLLVASFLRALPVWRAYAVEFALLLLFWAAMAYNVLVTYRNHGISASTGWYLCTISSAFLIVIAAGAWRLQRWWTLAIGLSFALISFYGEEFLSIPYYTGIIAHSAQGALPAMPISHAVQSIAVIASRLTPLSRILWPFAIAAQVALLAVLARSCVKMRLSR